MEADLAALPSPTPSSASNSTDDGRSNDAAPVASPSDDVHSWSELALQAVSKLSDDVEWIKWKANRVTFDILHDYGEQYGFYRLVVLKMSQISSFFSYLFRNRLQYSAFAYTRHTALVFELINTLLFFFLPHHFPYFENMAYSYSRITLTNKHINSRPKHTLDVCMYHDVLQ